MIKNRLFVFGDSWSHNYFKPPYMKSPSIEGFSKEYGGFGHWTDHMENFYDIINYGRGAVSNEQIIHQLGNLPDYVEGDRVIIILTTPERYTWYSDTYIDTILINDPKTYEQYNNDQISYVLQHQLVKRSDLWLGSTKRSNEKKFFNKIPLFLKEWNPIIVTWVGETAEQIECVELIEFNDNYTTIQNESDGRYKDNHLGVVGNYELFKFFSKKLNKDIGHYHYEFNKSIKKLL